MAPDGFEQDFGRKIGRFAGGDDLRSWTRMRAAASGMRSAISGGMEIAP